MVIMIMKTPDSQVYFSGRKRDTKREGKEKKDG